MSQDTHTERLSPWENWVSNGRRHAGRLFAGTVWSWANAIKWTGYTVLALLIGIIVYLYFLDWNTMRGPVSRYVSHRLGREVHINGDLQVHLFSWTPSMSASGVTIGNPDKQRNTVRNTFFNWLRQDQSAAFAWVQSANTIAPELRTELVDAAEKRRTGGK